jgi:diguanylate cyclase (GGDEF)-like protein/PAS domain S-box-containing protein
MNNLTILFVEDDLVDRINFKRFLKRENIDYICHIASSLQEAIELIDLYKFDIILTDINLHDGTAFDLYDYIPDLTPVIFITSDNFNETIIKALKLGVSDYIVKDIEGKHLQNLPTSIENIIEKQRYLQQQIDNIVKQHFTSNYRHEPTKDDVDKLAFKTHIGVVITDANASILKTNEGFSEITGYSRSEVLGQNMKILQSGKQNEEFYKDFWDQLINKGRYQGAIWNRRKNHDLYFQWLTVTAVNDPVDTSKKFVGILSDITAEYEAHQQIRQLAFYDPLTSLPNRRLLIDRLRQELAISKRTKLYGSLIYLDIDKFKHLNDSFGHHIGDQLLIAIAQRLHSILREEDTASRLGGDEFVILIHANSKTINKSKDEAFFIAEKIRNELSKVYHLEIGDMHFTVSLGISIFPEDSGITDEILQFSDQAMYKSKKEGGNRINFYHKSIGTSSGPSERN